MNEQPINPERVRELERTFTEFIQTIDRSRKSEVKSAFATLHRTHQQMFVREVVVPVFERLDADYQSGYYDLRNEGSCKFAFAALNLREDKHIGLPFV